MTKDEKYLSGRLKSINERIDSIISEALEDLTEDELTYIDTASPNVWFISTNPELNDMSEVNNLVDSFNCYNQFLNDIKNLSSVSYFNKIEDFKTAVNNIYKQKNGRIETDIDIYVKYDRILIIFYNMDSH